MWKRGLREVLWVAEGGRVEGRKGGGLRSGGAEEQFHGQYYQYLLIMSIYFLSVLHSNGIDSTFEWKLWRKL